MQAYAKDVVEEGEDGQLRIRLFRGLKMLKPTEASSEGVEAPKAPGVSKTAMTTLGLLHLLWQEARLNTWYPAMEGKRDAGLVSWALLKAAARVKAGRVCLSEVLLLPASKDSERQKANEGRVSRALEESLRAVVIAPLARYAEVNNTPSAKLLNLVAPFGIPFLYLNGQWARVQKRFKREISAWIAGENVMAIALVDLKPGNKHPQGTVLDVGLMQVSERWIPLDSSYEGIAEKRLREERRAFEKPMRFDAEEDVVFPDFWLLDTEGKRPMEVFGMATPEYLARKDVKISHYDGKYGVDGWWYWNASDDPIGKNLPAFLAKRLARRTRVTRRMIQRLES
jgi:hypothetical protein